MHVTHITRPFAGAPRSDNMLTQSCSHVASLSDYTHIHSNRGACPTRSTYDDVEYSSVLSELGLPAEPSYLRLPIHDGLCGAFATSLEQFTFASGLWARPRARALQGAFCKDIVYVQSKSNRQGNRFATEASSLEYTLR